MGERLLINGLFKLLKLAWRILKFTGLWFFILMLLLWDFVNTIPVLNVILDIPMFLLAFGGWFYLLAQNILRLVYRNPQFKLYELILDFKNNRGFVADKKEYHSEENTGIIFGKLNGNWITKSENKDGHVLVVGGAGSGKSSCIAIPTLRSWNSSIFAIDIKGELYEKTHEYRTNKTAKIFNPTDKEAWGFDPYYMMRNTDDIYSEAKALALAILPLNPQDKNPYFTQAGQSMLTGFILHYFNEGLSFSQTMQELKKRPVAMQIDEVMEESTDKAQMELNQFNGMDSKTLSNIYSTVSNAITLFATNDDLQRVLDTSDHIITPEDLEKGIDIYINIPEYKLEEWKNLLAMMINQFLKAFERRSESSTTPILFSIDEFARIGKIETITNGLATLRSKKIHIALFVQSKSQLNAIYGKDTAEIIADNCTYKAILKASEPTTQEWCSKLVGTFDKEKQSYSKNKDEVGFGKGSGVSVTTEEKRIIKPEEFAYLDDIVCLFPSGYLRVDKAPYYLEA